MTESPVPRPVARVLVIDAADRVLLFHVILASFGGAGWVAPGGGLLAGEAPEACAKRELEEEAGLTGVELGPCVWLRNHVYTYLGTTREARERFYVCRIDAHDVGAHLNRDERERGMMLEHRWWTAGEIEASSDLFVPADMGRLLRPILRGDLPHAPILTGS